MAQRDIMAEMDEWRGRQTVPLLDAFVSGRLSNFSQIENHCLVCQRTRDAELTPVERQIACVNAGCKMLFAPDANSERGWVQEQMIIFLIPELATDQQVMDFNDHLYQARACVIGLGTYPSGKLGRGQYGPTLLGRVHAALFGWVLSRAGDTLAANVDDLSGAEASEYVRREREARAQLRREKVRLLWQRGHSEFKIAEILGIHRNTVGADLAGKPAQKDPKLAVPKRRTTR